MNPAGQAEMTRAVLATALDIDGDTRAFRDAAVARITTDGAGTKYYDADTDKMLFETMPVEDIVTYLEEELLDVPNYAAMLYARGADPLVLQVIVEQVYLAYTTLDVVRRTLALQEV